MTTTVRSALPGRTYSGFCARIRLTFSWGPYSSSLTMSVAEIAEEYKKVLWNHGGSSDEIFRHGWRYLVGIQSPASDYLRALPYWLAEESRPSTGFVCCIQAVELSDGTSPVGFWNPPFTSLTTRCILSPSTFPGATTTSSLVSSPASIRRPSYSQPAFKTNSRSCEHALVGPVACVTWRRLLRAFVLFLPNLGRQRTESSGRASGNPE